VRLIGGGSSNGQGNNFYSPDDRDVLARNQSNFLFGDQALI
jgi:hypothetical protein